MEYKCICCKKYFAEEDLLLYNNKNMCSVCSVGFIKENIVGGLDCEDLINHIEANK